MGAYTSIVEYCESFLTSWNTIYITLGKTSTAGLRAYGLPGFRFNSDRVRLHGSRYLALQGVSFGIALIYTNVFNEIPGPDLVYLVCALEVVSCSLILI